MSKKIIKHIAIPIFSLAIITGVGLLTNIIKLPITRELHAQMIPGLDNKQILMGASHHVFVAKVNKQISNENRGFGGPETQFEVNVLYNIKGDLKGNAIVNQQGGYKNGILHEYNDSSLLIPGQTYIFATRYYKEKDWHTLSPSSNGKIFITDETNDLSINTIKNNKQILEFEEAYKNEILLDADIRHNNTLNNYESLNK